MEKKNKRIGLVFSIIGVGLLASFLFIQMGGRGVSAEEESYKELKVFTEVLSAIQKSYVEPVKGEMLIKGAIHGMFSTLDPHSSYMSPDVYKESQIDTKGEFGGLGLQVGSKENKVVVIAPIEGTPADRAGILAGDIIVKIDDLALEKEIGLLEAVHRMRGAKGTKVTLTIKREKQETPLVFSLVREIIHIQSVKSRVIEEGIGYIRLSQFQEQSARDLANALATLKAAKVHSLVLDLRNNPGGLLNASVEVSEQFLEEGKLVVSVKGRNGEKDDFIGHGNGLWKDIPLVILVNEGSASASEIVSSALQDWGRALILGTRTFGKGSVQTILPLSDGSALRLTTAKYYTPKGRSIQDEGVTPDIVVQRAGVEKRSEIEGAPQGEDKEDPSRSSQGEKGEKTDPVSKDVQLQEAINLLKSWKIFKGVDTARSAISMAEREN